MESEKLAETTTIETVMNKTEENGIRNATMQEEEEEYDDESEELVENEKKKVQINNKINNYVFFLRSLCPKLKLVTRVGMKV